MKRAFRPMLLAALCWLLVALVPATRNGLLRTAKAPLLPLSGDEANFDPGDFTREAERRFPHDHRVQLDALVGARSGSNRRRVATDLVQLDALVGASLGAKTEKIEIAAREMGDDAVVVSILLRAYLNALKSDRNEGPLSNPNGPGAAPPKKVPGGNSSRAAWQKFIALAKRGQTLEPNNTFFDWLILYGLYATRRDDEARAVLKLAARKTDYDDHSRDIVLNRLAVMRLVYGAPLSPADCYMAWAAMSNPEYGKMRQTARWVMEGAIADREAARHNRALDAAFDLAKMGRVMRRESYSLIGSLFGVGMQASAIGTIGRPGTRSVRPALRAPRFGTSLATLQSSPVTLYVYARNQKRADITSFLDREWPELGRWRKLGTVIVNQNWTGNSAFQTVALSATGRLRTLILRALPSILILGALFTLLSRRFRDDSGASPGGFWRGALAVAPLFALAMVFDGIIDARENGNFGDWQWLYFGDQNLLSAFPSWITIGIALALVLIAISAAVNWQNRQQKPPVSFKTRLQSAFDAPEDGLMRFDFGWVFGLVARSTSWILLLAALILLCFNLQVMRDSYYFEPYLLGILLLATTVLISLVLHFGAWRTRPRRRVTLRLGWRLISQSLLGFFVASSALYALVALAMLPVAYRYERNFEKAMQRGEVQIARAKLGL